MKVRTPEAQGLHKADQELRLPELAGRIGSPGPGPEEGGIEVAVVEDEDVSPRLNVSSRFLSTKLSSSGRARLKERGV